MPGRNSRRLRGNSAGSTFEVCLEPLIQQIHGRLFAAAGDHDLEAYRAGLPWIHGLFARPVRLVAIVEVPASLCSRSEAGQRQRLALGDDPDYLAIHHHGTSSMFVSKTNSPNLGAGG